MKAIINKSVKRNKVEIKSIYNQTKAIKEKLKQDNLIKIQQLHKITQNKIYN